MSRKYSALEYSAGGWGADPTTGDWRVMGAHIEIKRRLRNKTLTVKYVDVDTDPTFEELLVHPGVD